MNLQVNQAEADAQRAAASAAEALRREEAGDRRGGLRRGIYGVMGSLQKRVVPAHSYFHFFTFHVAEVQLRLTTLKGRSFDPAGCCACCTPL